MVFLDTHVALWLYAEADRIPAAVQTQLDESELFLSPMARLEIHFLHETGRLKDDPAGVLGALGRDLELRVEEDGWSRAALVADHMSWTRDPFDRLITAHALCYTAPLCTKNRGILNNYRHAFWA